MTPILKAYQTDMGFEVASLAIQTHGGAGYTKDYGVEQYARDARIAMIYEGTNGIQALDLVGRKMGAHMGRYLRRFFPPSESVLLKKIKLTQIYRNLFFRSLKLLRSYSNQRRLLHKKD